MSEIKSAIHVSVGGGSGESSKFGFSGEDDTAAENRSVNMGEHNFNVTGASSVQLQARDVANTYNSFMYADNSGIFLQTKADSGSESTTRLNLDSVSSEVFLTTTVADATSGEISENGVYLQPKWQDAFGHSSDPLFIARFNASKLDGSYSDLRLPYLQTGSSGADNVFKMLPISVNGNFADSSGNITISGGGGGSSRFGVSGEDVTSDANRSVDMDGNNFSIVNTAEAIIGGGDLTDFTGAYHRLTVNGAFFSLEIFDGTSNTSAITGNSTGGQISIQNQTATTSSAISLGNDGIGFNHSDGKYSFLGLAALDFADDASAATGGVGLNEFYHTSGVVKIRLT